MTKTIQGVRFVPLRSSYGLVVMWIQVLLLFFASLGAVNGAGSSENPVSVQPGNNKKLVYLVSDLRIPFWEIMSRGLISEAKKNGYKLDVFSAENSAKHEFENLARAIKNKVDGIIVSPTTSAACVTVLKLAEKVAIPVVISDIGTDAGDYVSYISSDNKTGAYEIGKVLTGKLHSLGWQDGRVGIIAIPQKRKNGRDRTTGFMRALKEAGIESAAIRQQSTFSYEETYAYSRELITAHSDLRAIWLQGSDRYQAALDAIADAGKTGQILLVTFDAEPVFLELIPKGILVGAAMQQPFLMGEQAVRAMHMHLNGKEIEKNQQLPILPISAQNIEEKLPLIKRNVLGLEARKN